MKKAAVEREVIRRRKAEIYRLSLKIRTPQQLANLLAKIESTPMRAAVYNMLKPMLKFKVQEGTDVLST